MEVIPYFKQYSKVFILISIITLLLVTSFFLFLPDNNINKQKVYVSLTFDDSYEEHFTNAFPILEKYNITATEYVIVDLIGGYFEGKKLMDLEEINTLNKNGWEIGSHSLTHPYLTRLSKDKSLFELENSKQKLQTLDFNITSFSVPYGDYNELIKEQCKENYLSVRTSIKGYNSLDNFDRYELKSQYTLNSTTLEEMKSWVDYSKKNDAWLIIMLHHISNNSSSEYMITPENLDMLIQYILYQGMEIKTVYDVIEENGKN